MKECGKKVNIYMKNYEIISNSNVDKETTKQNKEIIYKDSKYIEMCIKIYKNM